MHTRMALKRLFNKVRRIKEWTENVVVGQVLKQTKTVVSTAMKNIGRSALMTIFLRNIL
jgi:hypothetical protein